MTSLPITLLSRKDTFKRSGACGEKNVTFDLNNENCYWLRLSDNNTYTCHVKSKHARLQNNFWLICTPNYHVINNTWCPSRWSAWPNRLPRIGSDSISASSRPIKRDALWCALQCVACSGNWQLEGEIWDSAHGHSWRVYNHLVNSTWSALC